jgi:hypothetical protein
MKKNKNSDKNDDERALTWLAWCDEDPEIRRLAAEQLAANFGYAADTNENG